MFRRATVNNVGGGFLKEVDCASLPAAFGVVLVYSMRVTFQCLPWILLANDQTSHSL